MSTPELIRALAVLKLCSVRFIVKHADSLLVRGGAAAPFFPFAQLQAPNARHRASARVCSAKSLFVRVVWRTATRRAVLTPTRSAVAIVKKTFFAHFCAGGTRAERRRAQQYDFARARTETAEEAQPVVARLRESNIHGIMDYAGAVGRARCSDAGGVRALNATLQPRPTCRRWIKRRACTTWRCGGKRVWWRRAPTCTPTKCSATRTWS